MSLEPPERKTTVAAAAEVPFSLIESEILPRISSKSDIGRCMCVCKQWNSFLSTPSFAMMHLQKHGTIDDDYKLLLHDGVTFRTLPLNNYVPLTSNPDPDPDPNPLFILASLDGLVCIGSKEPTRPLVFWNPLTGAYKKLSTGPFLNLSKKIVRDAIGFYMDPCSGDYRLVCVLGGGGFSEAHIYSHRSDSWKRIHYPFPSTEVCVWSPPAYCCNQSIYFTVAHLFWIICFDVTTETFKKILFPPVPDGAIDPLGSLVVLSGCVHLCVSYKVTTYLKQGDLWRLDGDDGWVKVAAFTDPRDIELSVRRRHICTASTRDWVVVLDQENNSFKKLNAKDFTTHYQFFCSPSSDFVSSRMIYVETLVSPNP